MGGIGAKTAAFMIQDKNRIYDGFIDVGIRCRFWRTPNLIDTNQGVLGELGLGGGGVSLGMSMVKNL
jgi:hypothetical protein